MCWTPEQQDQEELLDLGAGTPAERRASLRDLRRLNRWLGGTAASRRELDRLVADLRPAALTLLDIGTGSADVPRALQAWARRRGVRLQVVAIDCKLEHLRIAREEGGELQFACADAFRLPFADAAFDVVHSALF